MAAPLPKQVAAGPEEEERWGGDDGDWIWTTADGIGLGAQGGGSWQGGLIGGGGTVAEQTGDQGSEKIEQAVKLDHADAGRQFIRKITVLSPATSCLLGCSRVARSCWRGTVAPL